MKFILASSSFNIFSSYELAYKIHGSIVENDAHRNRNEKEGKRTQVCLKVARDTSITGFETKYALAEYNSHFHKCVEQDSRLNPTRRKKIQETNYSRKGGIYIRQSLTSDRKVLFGD